MSFSNWPLLARFLFLFRRIFNAMFSGKKAITGTWDYYCEVLNGKDFPFDFGNIHGGNCTLDTKHNLYTTVIRVQGRRTWHGNKKGQTENIIKLESERRWESIEGAFIDKSKVMYQYQISGLPIVGISYLNLKFDKNDKKMKMEGEFYYFLDPQYETQTFHQKIIDEKIIKELCVIRGKVILTNQRKR